MEREFLDARITELARRCPHKTAVKSEERSVSYLELEENSNRVANFMHGKIAGVPHVALVLDRSPRLIEAIVGLLKCGLVFVPLDPRFPPNRVKEMIAQTGAEWVITETEHHETFKEVLGSPLKTWVMDGEDNVGTDSPGNRELAFERVFNQHCYIYFTSGSTGVPKGVLGGRRGLAHFIRWEIDEFGVDEHFNVSQMTPPSFDPFLRDIFLPLMAGATSCIPSRSTLMNTGRLIRWLDENRVSLVHTVPSLFKRLVSEIEAADCLHDLKYILLAGELLRGKDIDRFMTLFKGRIQAVNLYGPTETTLAKLSYRIQPGDENRGIIPVGKPIKGAQVLILDGKGQKCRRGKKGEIYIRTPFRSFGYYNDPPLTERLFIPNPFGNHPQDILYKTGDLGRLFPDGNIELSGRVDFQVKIRGVRIETGEIENRLLKHDDVREAVVTVGDDESGEPYLCAYVVPAPGRKPGPADLREHLAGDLPDYMIPSYFVLLEKIPLNLNGKIDRAQLPDAREAAMDPGIDYLPPSGDVERRIADAWKQVLKVERVGVNHNFFDLGGNSLKAMEVSSRLSRAFEKEIAVTRLFEYTTVRSLAKYIEETGETPDRSGPETPKASAEAGGEIAVIGMSCRFPGAKNIEEFWDNLRAGRETVSFFSEEELADGGVDPAWFNKRRFVRAASTIAGKERFDAPFFGYTPQEAELLDPQVRLFHECSWEALEDSGIVPERYPGRIGVFGGAAQNLEWEIRALLSGKSAAFGGFAASRLTGVRYLCTRLSYNLNLKGPSITMQTACSTSLVAIHTACRALARGECDAAIAGGVTVSAAGNFGYLYEEGLILSPDGHCRPFDARAGGTVFGEGVGVVVLKSLERALAEGYDVQAVIKGSAVNNDGSRKAGFTAPSVGGQVDVIRAALSDAGVEPGSIGCIEAHGTGTALGDPIEVEALKRVFPPHRGKSCKIGSVKSNFGHLDAAAGIAGFIKTVLALKHRAIPPSLHFEIPNPAVDFNDSPFEVNVRPAEWEGDEEGYPRRGMVNSMGMGGTNASLVLEEAPDAHSSPAAADEGKAYHLLLWSARTETALEKMTENLVSYFQSNIPMPGCSDQNLARAAYTLQVGRRVFKRRRMAVCADIEETVKELSDRDSRKVHTFDSPEEDRPAVFMFGGTGAQYPGLAADLYRREPVFRREADRCFEILDSLVEDDVRKILYPPPGGTETAAVHGLEIGQSATFTFQYALARLLMEWGIRPRAMIGYSFGEYTAACLSGVFSLEDALKLVVSRGRLLRDMPSGVMCSVPLTAQEMEPLLEPHEALSLAIDNGPSCIVAGTKEAMKPFVKQMKKQKVLCIPLSTSRAGHSKMMEPFLEEYDRSAGQVRLNRPQIPYISNVTGTWMTDDDALDPAYWGRHFRETVRFADGIRELAGIPGAVLVEIGPGRDLSALAVRHIEDRPDLKTLYLARPREQKVSDHYFLLNRIGRLWLWGVRIDWEKFHRGEKTRRVSLPTYPFEGQRYWLDADLSRIAAAATDAPAPPPRPPLTPEETAPPPVPGTVSPRPDVETEYVPPRDEVEQEVAHTWARFFGVERIGIDDDFFELGGDSLKALSILSQLNQRWQVELPTAEFIREPTIRNLASLMDDKTREKQFLDSMFGGIDRPASGLPGPPGEAGKTESDLKSYLEQPLAVFNRGTSNPGTLFCFPPGLAHGLAYRGLSALLADCSFYSFNFIEGDDRLEKYLEIMTRRQPRGPYILFGYSAAARLAFDVAGALEKRGLEVSGIILLDSLWPREDFNPEVAEALVEMIEDYLDDLGLGHLKERVLDRIRAYRRYFTSRTPPGKVNADVHVILSEENWDTPGAGNWKPFTDKNVHTYRGFGSHDEMLAPGNIEKNAEVIRAIVGGNRCT